MIAFLSTKRHCLSSTIIVLTVIYSSRHFLFWVILFIGHPSSLSNAFSIKIYKHTKYGVARNIENNIWWQTHSALTLALVISEGPLATSDASDNILSIFSTASFKFIAWDRYFCAVTMSSPCFVTRALNWLKLMHVEEDQLQHHYDTMMIKLP